MQEGEITITEITFSAFGRECFEIFYNKDIEYCKLFIWKYLCNTAVFKSIVEKECKFTVDNINSIGAEELTMLRYEPVVLDLVEMLKQKNTSK